MTKEELRKSLEFVCEERERLQENNEAMQIEMARTWKIADDYKTRIEKAIEYITYARTPREIYESGYGKGTCVEICMEHLQDILNGRSDK